MYKGILSEVTADTIKIVWTDKEKQGKKKVLVEKEIILDIGNIEIAKIKVSF